MMERIISEKDFKECPENGDTDFGYQVISIYGNEKWDIEGGIFNSVEDAIEANKKYREMRNYRISKVIKATYRYSFLQNAWIMWGDWEVVRDFDGVDIFNEK